MSEDATLLLLHSLPQSAHREGAAHEGLIARWRDVCYAGGVCLGRKARRGGPGLVAWRTAKLLHCPYPDWKAEDP